MSQDTDRERTWRVGYNAQDGSGDDGAPYSSKDEAVAEGAAALNDEKMLWASEAWIIPSHGDGWLLWRRPESLIG